MTAKAKLTDTQTAILQAAAEITQWIRREAPRAPLPLPAESAKPAVTPIRESIHV